MGIILLIAILAGSAYLVYKAVNGAFDSPSPKGKAKTPQANQAPRTPQPAQSSYRPQQQPGAAQGVSKAQQAKTKKSKYNLPSAY